MGVPAGEQSEDVPRLPARAPVRRGGDRDRDDYCRRRADGTRPRQRARYGAARRGRTRVEDADAGARAARGARGVAHGERRRRRASADRHVRDLLPGRAPGSGDRRRAADRDPEAFARARQTGEDLAVPLGRDLTEIAATKHQEFFAQEARFDPQAPNLREARALDAELAGAIEASQATAVVAAGEDTAGRVRDAMQAILGQVGMAPQTASVYAGLFESAYQAIGTRAGLDARPALRALRAHRRARARCLDRP